MKDTSPSHPPSRARATTLRITAAYVIVGVLWILFSDRLLGALIQDPATLIELQTIKGWLFVLATAYMIYTLIYRSLASKERSEQVLRESEQRHRTLVDSTSDAILLIDRKRKILSFNNAFLNLFGFERGEVEGKSTRIFHPSDDSFHSFGERVRSAMEQAVPRRIEWELMRKGGAVFPIEETYSAIRGLDGKTVGYVAIIRDITERKRYEEELRAHRNHLEEMIRERTRELEEAQRALLQREKLKTLGAISAEVAHEIRNPLVSIGGFARRLQKKYPESIEAEIILSESRRLEMILDRIINYLRPVEMSPKECSVNSVLTECLSLLSPELEQEHIALHLDFDSALPSAYADPAILCEVFINLIRNSASEGEKKGPLSIRTYGTDHYVQIDFKTPLPSGKQVDPEKIFLPFEEGGSGIAVSVSFRLLKDMGGLLFFTQQDNTSTFTIALPRQSAPGHDTPVDGTHTP